MHVVSFCSQRLRLSRLTFPLLLGKTRGVFARKGSASFCHSAMPPDYGSFPPPVHLDGTTLEGGGQLLRLALSLSSLTKIPIRVTDIRGNRGSKGRSGKGGGLKTSHLAGAEWLAQATSAETVGVEIKSRELTFRPAIYGDASLTPIPSDHPPDQGLEPTLEKLLPSEESFWRDIYESGVRPSHITMSTPGSVFLVLQAILPYILFSSASISKDTEKPIPVRLIIEGGTNVDASLSYEYASQVLFPILHSKLGIGPIAMTLQRRGWSFGRADVGSVVFDITPISPREALPPFSLTDRGEITKFHVSVLASSSAARISIRDLVLQNLTARYPLVEILFPVDEDSRNPKRLYLLIVAETANGFRLGRDWLYDQKINAAKLDQTYQKLVSKVICDLEHELAHGACVDEHLQDQLVIFQALAEGESKVESGGASLHAETARWVVEQILGPRFDKDGRCRGIGFKAGQRQWQRPALSESDRLAECLGRLSIEST
jgi:RNA 3'-terminal phosphate cyclase (ATP)